MDKYDITGMSCAACSARVEKAVSKLDGVEECSVNLLTNSMAVRGSAGSDEIIKAVESVNKSLITDILINLPANSKIRQKIIEKYGGSQND